MGSRRGLCQPSRASGHCFPSLLTATYLLSMLKLTTTVALPLVGGRGSRRRRRKGPFKSSAPKNNHNFQSLKKVICWPAIMQDKPEESRILLNVDTWDRNLYSKYPIVFLI